MIKEIIKDKEILSLKGEVATKDDLEICKDLLDTLEARKEECVGLAANMIGYAKRIICVNVENKNIVMINPVIVKTSKTGYEAEEGCLSHDETHTVKRFYSIRVEYYDMDFNKRVKTFSDFDAEVIQHEMDHLEGILI